jgi:transposase-like protein
MHYLWRAVDQNGVVLDILVQGRRNGAAAKRFFKHLLQGVQYKHLTVRCSYFATSARRSSEALVLRSTMARIQRCLSGVRREPVWALGMAQDTLPDRQCKTALPVSSNRDLYR